MKIDITAIKARVSLEDLLARDGHHLIPSSGHKKMLCPFHKEKSPSCCVYPDGHFYCFGCNASGDVIHYVMKRDGLKFVDACASLDGHARWDKFISKPFLPPPPRRETPPLAGAAEMIARWKDATDFDDLDLFAFELGVSVNSLMDLDCVWAAPHNAWAFPMRDHEGDTVGIRLRDKAGKKWAVTGSKEGLFFWRNVIGRTTWIVEGPTDTAAGITMNLNVVGRPSCQGAVKSLVALVGYGVKEVVIISDNDGPGLSGSARLEQHLPCPYREIVLPCKDLREFLKLGGTRQLLESMAAKQLPQRKPAK